MKKRLQVIVSLFSVIITAFTMTSLTLAWINTNKNVSKVTIKTGEGKFELHAGIYDRKVTSGTTDTFVDDEPNYAPTLNEANSTNEAIAFDFENKFGKVTLDSMVLNEHALNAAILPSYVFELHAHTTLDISYVRLSMKQLAYNGSPVANFELYKFQYLIVNNNVSSPLDYAAQEKLSELEESPLISFNGTTPVFLSEGADVYNAHEIVVPPSDIPFYSDHFAKSVLILLRPDPIAFYNFLKSEQLSGTQTKKAGIRFQLYTEFSLVPFGS